MLDVFVSYFSGQFGDWLESHNAIEGDKEDLRSCSHCMEFRSQ